MSQNARRPWSIWPAGRSPSTRTAAPESSPTWTTSGPTSWCGATASSCVTWEEPEGNLDEVVEALWGLNGEPFEVTLEEFHRVGLCTPSRVTRCSAQEAA